MKMIKLNEVLDVKRGANLSGDYYSVSGDKIRLTLGNFNYPNGGFKENTSKDDIYFIGPVKSEFILKKGDIITPLTEQVYGLLGETATIPEDDKYIQSGDVGLIIVDSKKLYNRYAYYLLPSPIVRKQLDAGAQQTKIRHTSPDKIKNCFALIPDMEYQIKAADLLDTLNNKISVNNVVISELESMAKTIYNYWFLQFDFPDENGKPYRSSCGKMTWNKDLKRAIPEGWSCGCLGDLFESQAGFAFKSANWSNEGYSVLSIKNINDDGTIDCSNTSYIKDVDDRLNSFTVTNGNMIFAMSGNTVGKLGIIASNKDLLYVNQRVLILKTSVNNLAYAYFTIQNKNIQNKIIQLAANSAQPNISEKDFRDIKICLPDIKVLEKYNRICESMFNKRIVATIENQELASLRDFLLPMLMNGQVTFKNLK